MIQRVGLVFDLFPSSQRIGEKNYYGETKPTSGLAIDNHNFDTNLSQKFNQLVVRLNGTNTPGFDVKFYGSDDNGTSWHAVYLQDLQDADHAKVTLVTNPSGLKWYRWYPPAGHNRFRVATENYASGILSVEVFIRP